MCDTEGQCVIQGGGACGTLTFEGKCINNGATVQWCEGGEVKEQNCAALGDDLICSWIPTQETYWCVNQCQVACLGKECGPDGCGGSCGSCDEGKVCEASGLCVTSGGGGECGDISAEGICEGLTLKYCSDNSLVEINCGSLGQTCGWDPVYNWNACVVDPNCTPNCLLDSGDPANPTIKECGDDGCGNQCGVCGAGTVCEAGLCVEGNSECGDITVTGVCEGNTLQYCSGGELYTIDCEASNQVCGFDMNAGWYDCNESTTSVSTGPLGGECGLLTSKGYCAENVLNSCATGSPTSIDCSNDGLYCAYQPTSETFGCGVTPPCVSSCPEGSRCQVDGTCGCDGVDYVGQCEGNTLAYCDEATLSLLECASIGMTCGFNGTFFLCVDVTE